MIELGGAERDEEHRQHQPGEHEAHRERTAAHEIDEHPEEADDGHLEHAGLTQPRDHLGDVEVPRLHVRRVEE